MCGMHLYLLVRFLFKKTENAFFVCDVIAHTHHVWSGFDVEEQMKFLNKTMNNNLMIVVLTVLWNLSKESGNRRWNIAL